MRIVAGRSFRPWLALRVVAHASNSPTASLNIDHTTCAHVHRTAVRHPQITPSALLVPRIVPRRRWTALPTSSPPRPSAQEPLTRTRLVAGAVWVPSSLLLVLFLGQHHRHLSYRRLVYHAFLCSRIVSDLPFTMLASVTRLVYHTFRVAGIGSNFSISASRLGASDNFHRH